MDRSALRCAIARHHDEDRRPSESLDPAELIARKTALSPSDTLCNVRRFSTTPAVQWVLRTGALGPLFGRDG
ncbi:MAG: hypothetical protein AAFQ82_25025, partial [Myxococcota bacterium]